MDMELPPPPTQKDAIPSLKKFSIPKQNKKKDLLTSKPLDSREGKEIISNIHNSLWESGNMTMKFQKLHLVSNEKLEAEYAAKRKEMKELKYTSSETSDSYAFLYFKSVEECQDICTYGLRARKQKHLPTSAPCSIGDKNYGVYLCRCADAVIRRRRLYETKNLVLLVFKVIKGRLKQIQDIRSSNNVVEPTPDYDGHVSKEFQRGRRMAVESVFDSSQMYLYEINLNDYNINDDSAMYSKRPRQCIPYAIVTLKAKEKITASIPPPRQINPAPVEPVNSNLSTAPNQMARPVVDKQPFIYENYYKFLRACWRGWYFTNNTAYADVCLNIFSNQDVKSPVDGPNLCISQKITIEKLSKILPLKIFRKAPCESLRPEATVNGLTFLHGEIHPSIPSQEITRTMTKLQNHFVNSNMAGFCNLTSGYKLFIIPTCDLTDRLGISNQDYPDVLHCIFMKQQTTHIPRGPDFESFIKNRKHAFRDRLRENEHVKKMNNKLVDISLTSHSYTIDERNRIFDCLQVITKALHVRRTSEQQRQTASQRQSDHLSTTSTQQQTIEPSTSAVSNHLSTDFPLSSTLSCKATLNNYELLETMSNNNVSKNQEKETSTLGSKDEYDSKVDLNSLDEETLKALKESAPDSYQLIVACETDVLANDSDHLVVISDDDDDYMSLVTTDIDDDNMCLATTGVNGNVDKTTKQDNDENTQLKTVSMIEFTDKDNNREHQQLSNHTDTNESGASQNNIIPLLQASDVEFQSSPCSLNIDTATPAEDTSMDEELVNLETVHDGIKAIGETFYDAMTPIPPGTSTLPVTSTNPNDSKKDDNLPTTQGTPVQESHNNETISPSNMTSVSSPVTSTIMTNEPSLSITPNSTTTNDIARSALSPLVSPLHALKEEMRKQAISLPSTQDNTLAFQDMSSSSDIEDMQNKLKQNRERKIAEKDLPTSHVNAPRAYRQRSKSRDDDRRHRRYDNKSSSRYHHYSSSRHRSRSRSPRSKRSRKPHSPHSKRNERSNSPTLFCPKGQIQQISGQVTPMPNISRVATINNTHTTMSVTSVKNIEQPIRPKDIFAQAQGLKKTTQTPRRNKHTSQKKHSVGLMNTGYEMISSAESQVEIEAATSHPSDCETWVLRAADRVKKHKKPVADRFHWMKPAGGSGKMLNKGNEKEKNEADEISHQIKALRNKPSKNTRKKDEDDDDDDGDDDDGDDDDDDGDGKKSEKNPKKENNKRRIQTPDILQNDVVIDYRLLNPVSQITNKQKATISTPVSSKSAVTYTSSNKTKTTTTVVSNKVSLPSEVLKNPPLSEASLLPATTSIHSCSSITVNTLDTQPSPTLMRNALVLPPSTGYNAMANQSSNLHPDHLFRNTSIPALPPYPMQSSVGYELRLYSSNQPVHQVSSFHQNLSNSPLQTTAAQNSLAVTTFHPTSSITSITTSVNSTATPNSNTCNIVMNTSSDVTTSNFPTRVTEEPQSTPTVIISKPSNNFLAASCDPIHEKFSFTSLKESSNQLKHELLDMFCRDLIDEIENLS